jgi:hypothetical protein
MDGKTNAGMKAGFELIAGSNTVNRKEGTAMREKLLVNGQRHRARVEVRTNMLRGFIDDEALVRWNADASAWQTLDITPGMALRDTLHLGIGALNRGLRIHKITVREVTGTGKVEANSVAVTPPAFPSIANWRDVTATLLEKARVNPGAVFEDGAVHLAKGGSPQRVLLTPPGVSRFAMRVRYTGGTQVDRVKEGSGFDFVICQKAQVGFKRVTNGDVTGDLAPFSSYPAGYDSNVPHDLLVTMDGAQIRAWVDGHFMGEVRDELITVGDGGLMLKDYTTIHKVEIAELAGN